MPGIISELGGLARKIMISNHMTQFEKSFFAYLSETKVQRFYHQIKICVSSFFSIWNHYLLLVKSNQVWEKKKKNAGKHKPQNNAKVEKI